VNESDGNVVMRISEARVAGWNVVRREYLVLEPGGSFQWPAWVDSSLRWFTNTSVQTRERLREDHPSRERKGMRD
jgi:hypothetical protein